MTINNTANKVVAAGNGVMTVFNFSFVGVEASDIEVIFTDANGNETTLLTTQYSLTLNAAPPGQIWGLGGTVTYPLVGSPIALGTTLTIARTVPLLQEVALGNQGNEFPSAVETALDLLMMALQQVSELFQRAIVAPIVDPTAPLPLPPAAQRANLALVFDASGNPVAGAIPASGVISSAMQPVVDAATLALGRTAFGLGSAAVEAIGSYGLADDGSGTLRQNIVTVADATNQAVDKTFHLTQRIATGPINYTLPRANTLWDGFAMWIFAISGNITVTPNANDQFGALAAGTAITVPQGSWCLLTTNAASSGTWYANYNGENIQLSASVSASALTIALNATSVKFRDTTLANGDSLSANVPSPCSITVPNGATLGTSNGLPSRVYVFLAYNNGSPVLGVALASTQSPIRIYPIASWETQQVSGALVNAAADSAGVLYTSAAVTNTAVRMLGYVEFAAGQATAGVWNTSPSVVQVMGAGIKKPGEVAQSLVAASLTGQANISSGTFGVVTNSALTAFSMQSACNLIRYNLTADITVAVSAGNNTTGTVSASRASTLIGPSPVMGTPSGGGGTGFESNVPFIGYDAPGVTSSLTYQFQAKATGTGAAVSVQSINGQVEEIVG